MSTSIGFGAAATSLDTLVVHALHMHTCLNRSSIAGRQSSSLNTLVSESCNSVYLLRRHTVTKLQLMKPAVQMYISAEPLEPNGHVLYEEVGIC